MNKMSSFDERAITKDLMSVVDAARAGRDASEALVKVAVDRGYTPPVVSRMCEAFNKAKSVHLLRSTPMEKRADDFKLLDAGDILKEIFDKPFEKKAAEFVKAPRMPLTSAPPVEKKAGIFSDVRPDPKRPKTDFNIIYDRLKKADISERAVIEKAAGEVRMARIKVERDVDRVASHLRPMANKEINKIAQRVHNKYGVKGDQLMAVVYAKLDKTLPSMEKTAKTTILPLDEPYLSLVGAMEGFKKYNESKNESARLEKTAVVGSLLAGLGLPSISDVAREHNKKDELDDKGDELLGPELVNKLKSLDAVDTFVDIYAGDPFLSGRPVDEALKAYNTVVSLMPYLMESDNKKVMIAPMMRKLIAEGNRIDPLEISTYIKNESEAAKADLNKHKTEAFERDFKKSDEKKPMKIEGESAFKDLASNTLSTLGGAQSLAANTFAASAKGASGKLKKVKEMTDKIPPKFKSLEQRVAKLPKVNKDELRVRGVVTDYGKLDTSDRARKAAASYLKGN